MRTFGEEEFPDQLESCSFMGRVLWTLGTASTGNGARMQAECPTGVPFRTQHPLGAVVNRSSVWSDR